MGLTCSGGACVCVPKCGGKACGDDGCGGQCGTCDWYEGCKSNQCLGWKWEAETEMAHEQGKKDGDGWSCNTADNSKNMMVYGPYYDGIPGGTYTAYFRMLIDNNTAGNDTVVKIDAHDFNLMDVLAEKKITRKQFTGTFTYQDFALQFACAGGHKMEFRVEWYDTAYIKVDRVVVKP